jgi:hypothetical protein
VPAARIAEIVFNYLFGRALRRAMLVALIGVFTLTAIYHFTIAGTLALEAQYGLLYARLIVGAALFRCGVDYNDHFLGDANEAIK